MSQSEMPCSAMRSAGLVVHEGAAAGGEHDRPFLQQAGDHPALAVAKMVLAVDGEDFGDRHAGCGLDLVISIAERQLERLREPAAHGALSGTHETDEHERSRAEPAA